MRECMRMCGDVRSVTGSVYVSDLHTLSIAQAGTSARPRRHGIGVLASEHFGEIWTYQGSKGLVHFSTGAGEGQGCAGAGTAWVCKCDEGLRQI